MTPSTSPWLRRLAWLGVVIWMTTITILSSHSAPQLEKIEPFHLWDKAAHFLAFAAGSVDLTLALCWTTTWPWKKVMIVAVVAISVFGAIDEIHQLWTPFRSGADVRDWTADTLGAAAGALATILIYARNSRTPRAAAA